MEAKKNKRIFKVFSQKKMTGLLYEDTKNCPVN